MDKMQEEALRRVSQMQGNNSNRRVTGHNNPTAHEKSEEAVVNTPPKEVVHSSPLSETTDPLSGLFKDKEKLLVLLLIMLLSEESSNTELVLALLYIII